MDVLPDDAALGIHGAGHADADAFHGDAERARPVVGALDDVEEGAHGGSGPALARGLLRLGENFTVVGDETGRDDGAAQVHPDHGPPRHQSRPKWARRMS